MELDGTKEYWLLRQYLLVGLHLISFVEMYSYEYHQSYPLNKNNKKKTWLSIYIDILNILVYCEHWIQAVQAAFIAYSIVYV